MSTTPSWSGPSKLTTVSSPQSILTVAMSRPPERFAGRAEPPRVAHDPARIDPGLPHGRGHGEDQLVVGGDDAAHRQARDAARDERIGRTPPHGEGAFPPGLVGHPTVVGRPLSR